MPLSLKQLQDVCLMHSRDFDKCRYLAQDDIDSNHAWFCLKKSSKKSEIDDDVADLLKDFKKNGTTLEKKEYR